MKIWTSKNWLVFFSLLWCVFWLSKPASATMWENVHNYWSFDSDGIDSVGGSTIGNYDTVAAKFSNGLKRKTTAATMTDPSLSPGSNGFALGFWWKGNNFPFTIAPSFDTGNTWRIMVFNWTTTDPRITLSTIANDLTLGNGCGAGSSNNLASVASKFTDNNYHYTVINYNPTNAEIFIDGASIYVCNYGRTETFSGDTVHFVQLYTNSAGSITDDLALFNDPLTSDQVYDIYDLNQALPNYAPIVSCQPGYELVDDVCTAIDYGVENSFFFDNPYSRTINTTAKIPYVYNEDIFTPYDYIEINRYASATSTTKTLIGTSTIIDYNKFDKQNGQSYFTLTGTSTITGLTYYGITGHLAAYWDATTQQDVAATTTTEFIVIVDWLDQTIPTPEEILANQYNGESSASSSANVLNLDTYTLACTAAEWASTSSMPITGWNVDKTVCRIKKWVLDVGLTPAFWIQDKTRTAGRILSNTFPFGVVKQISKSWQDSDDDALPAELAWLTPIDENNDLYVNMPAGFTGSATSTKVVLWGDSIFKNGNTDIAGVFANIRVLSKYLLWAGFLWAIYRMGKNIYEELVE